MHPFQPSRSQAVKKMHMPPSSTLVPGLSQQQHRNTEAQSHTDTQKLHSLLAVERALAPMLRIKEYACFLLLTLISTHKDAYSTNLNSGARALSTATQKHRSSGKHRHTGAPVCWLLRAL